MWEEKNTQKITLLKRFYLSSFYSYLNFYHLLLLICLIKFNLVFKIFKIACCSLTSTFNLYTYPMLHKVWGYRLYIFFWLSTKQIRVSVPVHTKHRQIIDLPIKLVDMERHGIVVHGLSENHLQIMNNFFIQIFK